MPATYYPLVGFYFQVVFTATDFVAETSFQEVSGLTVELPVEEVVEGGQLQFVHRLPKPARYSNLVLKRGLASDSKLRAWVVKAVTEFQFVPANVQATVMLLDETASPRMTWNVHNVRPAKWELSAFDAKDPGNLVIETLELAFDYFDFAKG
jgi:phage tail-like protein